MSVEDLIIYTIIKNCKAGFNFTPIDDLYFSCQPHGQALVERKCRYIREHGRFWEGKVYKIEIAAKDLKTKKITAYRLKNGFVSEPVKVKFANCFQPTFI